jgi:poly(A) polymerase
MADVRETAASIVRRLRAAGHEAYFAGGCVRDQLLGRTPEDYDVATSAPPEHVRALFPRTVPVGMQFGVILVLEAGHEFQVATFRSDDAYVDGRRPSRVYFGSAEADAQRRDFTINALFLDPETGRVLDFVDGEADLAAGRIRAIGDPGARIAEDRLRMLRAVRFAARFGFVIDEETRRAIRQAAPTLVDIAAERIGEEIVKILTEGAARRGFELLHETELLAIVLPEIAAMQGVAQSPDHHPEGDVWRHTLLLLQQLPAGVSETLALGALLHDVAKPETAAVRGDRVTFWRHAELGAERAVAICQRLRRSRSVWERVEYLVRHHLRLVEAPVMRPATLKRLLAADGFDELCRLVRLDALASSCDLGPVLFCEAKRRELAIEELRPPPLLGGRDVLAMGYEAGPRIGEILRAIEDAQLDGALRTREEAESFVRDRFPRS